MHEIEDQKAILESDPDKLEVLFKEMVQMCLWWVHLNLRLLIALISDHRGNATVSSRNHLSIHYRILLFVTAGSFAPHAPNG